MPRKKQPLSSLEVARQARAEVETRIMDLERELNFYRGELKEFMQMEQRLSGDPKVGNENRTVREMAYFYLQKKKQATLKEIVNHYYPDEVGKKRQYKSSFFTRALDMLAKDGSIEIIKPKKGTRGKIFKFVA